MQTSGHIYILTVRKFITIEIFANQLNYQSQLLLMKENGLPIP